MSIEDEWKEGVYLEDDSAYIYPHYVTTAPHISEHWRQCELVEVLTPKFKVGDKVRKVSGDYHLDGIVVSKFETQADKERFVVEHEPGFLHIYNGTQLEVI